MTKTVLHYCYVVSFLMSLHATAMAGQPIKLAASALPPNGLAVEQVPQFVSLGFDDNNDAAGVEWTLQTLAKFNNPPGVGQKATFDGQKIKASFFPNCGKAKTNPALLASWRKIAMEGHEIGNHTFDHVWGQNLTVAQWQKQMADCTAILSLPFASEGKPSGAGIAKAAIEGFRAPFLMYNDGAFTAMSKVGLTYDVSIQEGLQADQNAANHYWPYTLDNGSAGAQLAWWQPKVTSHPGIWVLPLHMLEIIPDNAVQAYGLSYSLIGKIHNTLKSHQFTGTKLTAFDFNWYASDDWMYALNGAEVLALLKYNLDRHLSGNRAPLVLGFHSDYLSEKEIPQMTNSSAKERRAVLDAFIAYAVSKKSVRLVRHIDIIHWMKAPTKLANGEIKSN